MATVSDEITSLCWSNHVNLPCLTIKPEMSHHLNPNCPLLLLNVGFPLLSSRLQAPQRSNWCLRPMKTCIWKNVDEDRCWWILLNLNDDFASLVTNSGRRRTHDSALWSRWKISKLYCDVQHSRLSNLKASPARFRNASVLLMSSHANWYTLM